MAVATLHPENGTVNALFPSFGAPGGGMSGDCNAAFTQGGSARVPTFFKIVPTGAPGSNAGSLLAISAVDGKILKNLSLTGETLPPAPGTETFLAGPDANGMLYTAAPLAYTSYTVFSYDTASGLVKQLATVPKDQMDGIGYVEARAFLVLRLESTLYCQI